MNAMRWITRGSRLSTPKAFGGCHSIELPRCKAAAPPSLGRRSRREVVAVLILAPPPSLGRFIEPFHGCKKQPLIISNKPSISPKP